MFLKGKPGLADFYLLGTGMLRMALQLIPKLPVRLQRALHDFVVGATDDIFQGTSLENAEAVIHVPDVSLQIIFNHKQGTVDCIGDPFELLLTAA
jgi:hypothetical protein